MAADRPRVRDREPALLRAEMGPGAADIAQVVGEVRERMADVVNPPPPEGEQARFSGPVVISTAETPPIVTTTTWTVTRKKKTWKLVTDTTGVFGR